MSQKSGLKQKHSLKRSKTTLLVCFWDTMFPVALVTALTRYGMDKTKFVMVSDWFLNQATWSGFPKDDTYLIHLSHLSCSWSIEQRFLTELRSDEFADHMSFFMKLMLWFWSQAAIFSAVDLVLEKTGSKYSSRIIPW